MVNVVKLNGCRLFNADCLDVLRKIPDDYVDAIVTDPPAGIQFMNKEWDKNKGSRDRWIAWLSDIASECLRVVKPGAHAFVWSIPRTSHWTTLAFENAGWEVRDKLAHIFGSGVPKSLNIAKAINRKKIDTDKADKWNGWGTNLAPAVEYWILLRKPVKGRVIDNVLQYGTGALNIDNTRISCKESLNGGAYSGKDRAASYVYDTDSKTSMFASGSKQMNPEDFANPSGRWPKNIVLSHDPRCVLVGTEEEEGYVINRFVDGMKPFGNGAGHEYASSSTGKMEREVWACVAECPVRILDAQAGVSSTKRCSTESDCKGNTWGGTFQIRRGSRGHTDSGGRSRFYSQFHPFYYCKKVSKKEKTMNGLVDNKHPTVKSIALMQHLCRTITPEKGVVLDPFMGSGSTGIACVIDGFRFVGIENDEESFDTAIGRVEVAIDEKSKGN